MGNRGRFGKYGDVKRIARLRRARKESISQEASIQKNKARDRFKNGPVDGKRAFWLRFARKSDTDFIIDLSARVFHEYGPYEKIIEEWLHSNMTFTILSVHGRRPVGFAMINLLPEQYGPEDEVELLAIAVEPDMHRSGIGQRLVRVMEKKAREMGIKRMVLHTAQDNFIARRLFKKTGFVESKIEKRFYPKGQDALLMIKEILPSESFSPARR